MKKCLVLTMAVLLLLSFSVAALARTSASYGYLEGLYNSGGGAWTAEFDLLSVTYESGYDNEYTTDIQSTYNESSKIYRHSVSENCFYYSCEGGITTRRATPSEFLRYVDIGSACYVFYLDDEIVAIADAD